MKTFSEHIEDTHDLLDPILQELAAAIGCTCALLLVLRLFAQKVGWF